MISYEGLNKKLAEKWALGENTYDWSPVEFDLHLAGLHQMQNAASVYAAVCKLKSVFPE